MFCSVVSNRTRHSFQMGCAPTWLQEALTERYEVTSPLASGYKRDMTPCALI